MRILGIIPARYGSTRFPGKPLVDIDGMSMIHRVYAQARQASSLSRVIVATDDERIQHEITHHGGEAVMTFSHHLNGTSRCAEVLSQMTDAYDVVINIQGDEPYIHPDQINQLAALLARPDVQIGTLVKKSTNPALYQNSTIIKVVTDIAGRALYFSRAGIPFYRDEKPHTYLKHIGIYGYRSSILHSLSLLTPTALELAEQLEQLRWLENGYHIHTAYTEYESQSVDVPEDIARLKMSH